MYLLTLDLDDDATAYLFEKKPTPDQLRKWVLEKNTKLTTAEIDAELFFAKWQEVKVEKCGQRKRPNGYGEAS